MSPSEILKFYRDSIAAIFGGMGYSNPPDDFSGVVIDGKTYWVMMRNDGCYVWFDEQGRKHLLRDTPRVKYEFINIKDARVSTVKQCYRTPGGEVEVKIHTYMNNRGEVLMERIFVINSTDVDIPIDTRYESIPELWVPIDCHIAEMTDRELIYVLKCYHTPGGKVQVEGIESFDPRINPEVFHYEVLQTTDEDIPAGTEYSFIPATWSRMVCDFPDMTGREILSVTECYDTGTGRVKLEGYRVFDYIMDVRKEWYRVKESTDPRNPVGTIITSIDEDWSQVVCDFTDMEDRDIEVTTECYKTNAGKVKLEVLTSWDGNIGVRDKSYKVLETTDPSQPEGASFSSLPSSWVRTVCDFDNMEERDIKSFTECFVLGNGKRVKTDHIISYDSKISARHEEWLITRSEDEDVIVGDSYLLLPVDWNRAVCDMPDMESRFLDTTDTCYDTGNGMVKIRRQESIDFTLGVRAFDYKIVESTDNAHPINTTPTQNVVDSWTIISCDLSTIDVDDCYEIDSMKIHLKGIRVVNPALQDIKSKLYVVYSEHPDYNVGDELTEIPEGAKVAVCEYADRSQRHALPFKECYSTLGGDIYIEGHRIVDNKLEAEIMRATVMESTDPTLPVGTEITKLQNGATLKPCRCKTC